MAVDVLHAKLLAAKAASADHWTDAAEELANGVCARLRAARDTTLRRAPAPGRLSNSWRGPLIMAAYQNLHAAESLIVHLYTPEQVDAEIPEAVARVEAGLDRDDPRRVDALALLAEAQGTTTAGERPGTAAPGGSVRVARLAKAMEIGFGAAH